MTKYEMLYILDASLSDEAKESIDKKLEDLVKTSGGAVESIDRWERENCSIPLTINPKATTY